MFTDRIGLEFLGMTPSNHDLRGRDSLSAVGKLADVDVLPPTLIVQYHFNNYGKFHLFIGAGVNYTLFFDENIRSPVDDALGGNISLDIDESLGLAFQAGIDYMLNDRWYLNTSVWYVDIDADATLTTNGVDRDVDVDIDPWVYFTGIGIKF